MPSSVLVLTCGALAAAGDLLLWQVILAAIAAFVVGDQIAFNGGRLVGPGLLTRMRAIKRIAPIVDKVGYVFAGDLPQISDLVVSLLIVGVALLCAVAFGFWTIRAWRKFEISETR